MSQAASGPIKGLQVIEFESIGPGPFAAMMLSDMGADVVTIARAGAPARDSRHFVQRGRKVLPLDLKLAADVAAAERLVAGADVVIEGFRPGVMERLGLGPEKALAINPALVYGRMTGWGQEGPWSRAAGHDINYISITGALASFAAADGTPVQPLNLVGDYGGGALYLVVGLLAGVIAARNSGQGQVVDAAMCDGVSHMLTMFQGLRAMGKWIDRPRANLLDGGAHFYGVYACADGLHLAVGAIEPQFYALLREIAALDDPEFDAQLDREAWPRLREKAAAIFLTRTRDEWAALFEGADACVTPILTLDEAPGHPHLAAREIYVEANGHRQPAPAPRFSRTPAQIQPTEEAGSVEAVLRRWKSGERG
jgi:alpha-methylacyl-CoA racemase